MHGLSSGSSQAWVSMLHCSVDCDYCQGPYNLREYRAGLFAGRAAPEQGEATSLRSDQLPTIQAAISFPSRNQAAKPVWPVVRTIGDTQTDAPFTALGPSS